MRLALAAASWVLAASFPQGRLYSRQEAEGLIGLRPSRRGDARRSGLGGPGGAGAGLVHLLTAWADWYARHAGP